MDAVRVVLDEHPAPAAPFSETQARATGQIRQVARQALTEKEFRQRYVDRHQSLYDIAKQTGFSRQTLTRPAAEYGIALREGPQDYKRKGVIDRDWLFPSPGQPACWLANRWAASCCLCDEKTGHAAQSVWLGISEHIGLGESG
jgi:hypothetical protein